MIVIYLLNLLQFKNIGLYTKTEILNLRRQFIFLKLLTSKISKTNFADIFTETDGDRFYKIKRQYKVTNIVRFLPEVIQFFVLHISKKTLKIKKK